MVLAGGGVDLGLHAPAELLPLVLHALDDIGDAAAAQGLLDVEAIGFVGLEKDVHLVDAAEEIVQVAHDVLVGAGEEDAEVVGLVVERVQGEVVLRVLQIDERGDLAVGVAGDVDEDGVDGRFLIEPVQRGDGEKLLQRPMVEQGLEDREIADVLVGEERDAGRAAPRAGSRNLATLLGDLFADLPEQRLGGGAVLEVEVAEIEERERLLLLLHGVVEALEPAELGLVLQHDLEIGDDLVLHLGLVLVAEGLALVDALEDLDDEQRVGATMARPDSLTMSGTGTPRRCRFRGC
jgi:hypothetical protein